MKDRLTTAQVKRKDGSKVEEKKQSFQEESVIRNHVCLLEGHLFLISFPDAAISGNYTIKLSPYFASQNGMDI